MLRCALAKQLVSQSIPACSALCQIHIDLPAGSSLVVTWALVCIDAPSQTHDAGNTLVCHPGYTLMDD